MNKNMIYAAIPFGLMGDVALMAKAFTGYSDPTLMVLGVGGTVIAILLVLKAFDLLRLPRYTGIGMGARSCQPEVKEVHHHHYHESASEDDGEDANEAYNRGYEEGKNDAADDTCNFDEGYEQGKENGYEAGYEARKNEEETEAKALAKYIMEALKMDKEAEAVAASTIAQAATTQAAL